MRVAACQPIFVAALWAAENEWSGRTVKSIPERESGAANAKNRNCPAGRDTGIAV